MTLNEAIKAAQALLKDEANSLACASSYENYDKLPHRAKVAIQREICRIREVSETLAEGVVEGVFPTGWPISAMPLRGIGCRRHPGSAPS